MANYLQVKDLTNAIVRIINKRVAGNVIYNISKQIYFKDLVEIISFYLGKKPPKLRVPIWIALFASWFCDFKFFIF